MPPLSPVAFELRVVAAGLILGGLAPALMIAAAGTGGLVVASILLASGGIYFAVVATMRRAALAQLLDAVLPAPEGAQIEARGRTVARGLVDALIGVAVAATTVLVGVGFVGLVLVLGLGSYRVWQGSQVRRWERMHGRELLRAPSIARLPLDPAHLSWRPGRRIEDESSLRLTAAPPA